MKILPRSKQQKEGGGKEMKLSQFSAKQRAKIRQDTLEEEDLRTLSCIKANYSAIDIKTVRQWYKDRQVDNGRKLKTQIQIHT